MSTESRSMTRRKNIQQGRDMDAMSTEPLTPKEMSDLSVLYSRATDQQRRLLSGIAALRAATTDPAEHDAGCTCIDCLDRRRAALAATATERVDVEAVVRETMNALGVHPWFPRTADVLEKVHARLFPATATPEAEDA